MKIILSTPLAFIREPNLLSFYVEEKNGCQVIVDGNYRQVLKLSEYNKILDANLNKPAAPVQTRPSTTAKELRAEAKALDQSEADEKARIEKEEADEKDRLDADKNQGSNKLDEKL